MIQSLISYHIWAGLMINKFVIRSSVSVPVDVPSSSEHESWLEIMQVSHGRNMAPFWMTSYPSLTCWAMGAVLYGQKIEDQWLITTMPSPQ
jgi:hypothetical protein